MLYLNSMFIPKKSAMAFYQNQLWKHWQVQACFILVKNPRTARLLKKFSFFIHCCRGNILAKGEREFPFPVIPKNGGLWFPFPNFGNGFCHSLPVPEFRECLFFIPGLPVPEFWEWIFFIPFPFPNFGNGNFSFPSRSRILGMDFFHSLPVPKIWDWIFLFPSRSQILGMGFFNSLPIPELWEWNFLFLFPFPNPQKSFPLTPEI